MPHRPHLKRLSRGAGLVGLLGALAALTACGGPVDVDVPVVLGSRATHVRSAMGGYAGRPLRSGDRLSIVAPPAGRALAPGASSTTHSVSHTSGGSNVHGEGGVMVVENSVLLALPDVVRQRASAQAR